MDTAAANEIVTGSDLKLYHYVGDFFNILKAFIGTNYQALPFAFHNSGVFCGVVGVLFIAMLTDHCCQLMVRCKYYAIDQLVEGEATKGQLNMKELADLRKKLGQTLGYGDIGRTVFGNWCYHLIQFAVWFTQFTTCTCYFIFIGNTVYKMFPQTPVLIPLNNHTVNMSTVGYLPHRHGGYGVPILHVVNIGKRSVPSKSSDFAVKSQSFSQFAVVNSTELGLKFKPYTNTSYVQESGSLDQAPSTPHVMIFANESAEATLFALSLLTGETTRHPASSTETITAPNVTTVGPNTTTTHHPTHLPTEPPTPELPSQSTAPDLKWVVMFPLPFFIITSLIRKVRLIAPFSTIATVALGIGAMSVFAKICADCVSEGLASGVNYWISFSSLPLFIGQLISAYEGIGCIIPIESSMEGNRWVFPWFLHAAIYIVFVILSSFGIIGYLTYGDGVQQLVVLNIPSGGLLSYFIDVTLIISVLFTYPLQCFPVIEITESYLFGPGSCCRPALPRLEYDEIGGGGNRGTSVNDDEEQKGLLEGNPLEMSTTSVSTVIPPRVPGWKRNIVRLLLTLSILGLAVLCRNAYAYVGAFTGAVGCALLAYIIPCAIHLKVKHGNLSRKNLIKDWGTIIFSISISILTLVVIIKAIVEGKMT